MEEPEKPLGIWIRAGQTLAFVAFGEVLFLVNMSYVFLFPSASLSVSQIFK